MKEKILKYKSFSDDFFHGGEGYCLPDDYKWLRTDARSKLYSALSYTAAIAFSAVYLRVFLHLHIKGAKKLRREKSTGFFIYGNHTQHFADVFIPALAALPKRIYTVVSPENMALPGIGKILPYLGALPLPSSLSGMRGFLEAVEKRLSEASPVVIYPEAHVWDYCTFVRPFGPDSFRYPLKYEKPVYSMTTTYQKRRLGRKPKITVYVDGPFYPPAEGSIREKSQALRDEVFDCMTNRSKLSNCEYIKYEKI